MGIKELPNQALEEAVKSVDKHIGETYDKLVTPPASSIGIGLSNIVDLVFSPFRYFNNKASMSFEHKLKIYKKELEDKEKSIPDNKKAEPDFHTISLALDNSKFCISNDELRAMFVNLIGNSLNKDTKDLAHPAFSEIIKQLTSLDATIISSFAADESQPIVEIREQFANDTYRIICSDYYLPTGADKHTIKEYSNSINNLKRLGLIMVDYNSYLSNDKFYSRHISNIKKMNPNYLCGRGRVVITEMGRSFIKICCK